jgi:hypothetical protein
MIKQISCEKSRSAYHESGHVFIASLFCIQFEDGEVAAELVPYAKESKTNVENIIIKKAPLEEVYLYSCAVLAGQIAENIKCGEVLLGGLCSDNKEFEECLIRIAGGSLTLEHKYRLLIINEVSNLIKKFKAVFKDIYDILISSNKILHVEIEKIFLKYKINSNKKKEIINMIIKKFYELNVENS